MRSPLPGATTCTIWYSEASHHVAVAAVVDAVRWSRVGGCGSGRCGRRRWPRAVGLGPIADTACLAETFTIRGGCGGGCGSACGSVTIGDGLVMAGLAS